MVPIGRCNSGANPGSSATRDRAVVPRQTGELFPEGISGFAAIGWQEVKELLDCVVSATRRSWYGALPIFLSLSLELSGIVIPFIFLGSHGLDPFDGLIYSIK